MKKNPNKFHIKISRIILFGIYIHLLTVNPTYFQIKLTKNNFHHKTYHLQIVLYLIE